MYWFIMAPYEDATFWELRHLLSPWCKSVIGEEQESRVAQRLKVTQSGS